MLAAYLVHVGDVREALQALTEAVGTAVQADAVVLRLVDESGEELVAQAVWGVSPAFTAELVGSRRRVDAEGNGDAPSLRLPIRSKGNLHGELELRRLRRPFDRRETDLAATVAAQLALVLEAVAPGRDGAALPRARVVQLVADALAAVSVEGGAAGQLVRLAVETAGADGAALWRADDDSALELLALHPPADAPQPALQPAATQALEPGGATAFENGVLTLRLGEPPVGALQLRFEDATLSEDDLAQLATLGARAAQVLRARETLTETTAELERTRALVAVIGQAIAQLSLTHTLETAVDRIGDLLAVDRVAVYLREDGRLLPVAGRGMVGPHARVGERLLALAFGPFRGRGALIVPDSLADENLADVRGELAESGIEGILAVPLLAPTQVIGLLAVYPPQDREIDADEAALMSALAAQLAVVVENARLHEEAKRLGTELEQALGAERQFARQLRALFEISRSFTQSMSLQATLDAVTQTAVETLAIDAAVMRMPDNRGRLLQPRSLYVAEGRPRALEPILARPQPTTPAAIRRLLSSRQPLVLDRRSGAPGNELLLPFLDNGASCVVVPVATPGEVLGMLTLLSLDPSQPMTRERVDLAQSIAAHAALAIDNARLYQQQKEFADAMQRSLLPRDRPDLPGLDLGEAYESSAHLDVGGDVYDFLALADGRLAIVLGDVTGHGVDAAADMAMAKFVFRSLAREHPQPGEFLVAANDVVATEISMGKFVTLTYVSVDVDRGEVACASAGHPPPRLVHPDGAVVELAAQGLPLGIEGGERYGEVRELFAPGATLVLYTDGVVEERRGSELYGVERLDDVIRRNRSRSANEIASTILEDCREYGGGVLVDDCAIVVIKRDT